MPANRNNNPSPSHNGTNSDENSLITSIHYQDWIRILNKSSREAGWVFCLNFVIYLYDTLTLVFTLITGFGLPGERTENAIAIALYILTCAVTAAAEYTR